MAGIKVTLGGTHLDLCAPIEWALTTGTQPYQTVITTTAGEAAGLLRQARLGKPTTLEIADQGGGRKVFQHVYILGEAPTNNHNFRSILISDRRWKWSRALVVGSYNVRRRTGKTHLAGEGNLVPLEIQGPVDEWEQAPWSLRDGKLWRPQEIVSDVCDKIGAGTDQFEYQAPKDIPGDVEIRDLDLAHPGNIALEVLLDRLNGVDLYQATDGKIVFFNSNSGAEIELIKSMGVQIWGQGYVPPRKFDFSGTRPHKIRVYMVPEYEVRIDSVVEGQTIDVASAEGRREMSNVIPTTDPTLQAVGTTVGPGTFLDVDNYLTAINAAGDTPDGIPPISHTIIQQSFFEDALLNMYVPWGSSTPQPIWMGRLAAIKSHYRQTFKIERRWMDGCKRVLPYRSGMVDTISGRRSPALCYSDYAVWVSDRNVSLDPENQNMIESVLGYDPVLMNGRVAPAVVSVLDEQVGIIRLDFQTDLYGRVKKIFPSDLVNIPTANIGNRSRPTCVNEVTSDGEVPKLASNDRKAVVLTMVPAAPNSLGRLFGWEVEPGDVKNRIPGGEIGVCNGPVWEVFVDPGVVSARFAWSDADTAAIERCFGVGAKPGVQGDEEARQDRDALKALLTNKEQVEEFAKAVAASMWSKMLDRPLGAGKVRFNGALYMIGAVKRIAHQVDGQGVALTSVELAEERRDIDPTSLLPDQVREAILRELPS